MCGFEAEVRHEPSQIQQAQLCMRLEIMMWRMMPAQFDHVHHRNKPPLATIEEKFARLVGDFNSFFGPEGGNTASSEKLVTQCADIVSELVPVFFRRVMEAAPRRRIALLLIYGCLALAFTESELLMHVVR